MKTFVVRDEKQTDNLEFYLQQKSFYYVSTFFVTLKFFISDLQIQKQI